MPSPTQRSKEYLEDDGYLVAITEKWNPHARIRQDLYGFIDLLALREGETLAVQTTTRNNASKRLKKIQESPNLAAIRKAGWRIHIHGWYKKAGRWHVKIIDIS